MRATPGDGSAPVAGGEPRRPRPAARRPLLRSLLTVAAAAAVLVPGATPAGAARRSPVPVTTAAASGPALVLVSQTPWVTPAQPTFDVHLRLGATAPAPQGVSLAVTVTSCLSTVSALDQTFTSSSPVGSTVAHTPTAIPWAALPAATGGTVNLPLQVNTTSSSPATLTAGDLAVPLRAADSDCGAGVYPVRLTLVATASGATLATLATDLVYVTEVPPQKLRVATVLPLADPLVAATAPTVAELEADPTAALARPSAARLAALAQTVEAVAGPPTAPVTVAVGGQLVQSLVTWGHQPTVAALARLSTGGTDQFAPSPYTPVDAAGLVDAGLPDELATQLTRSLQLTTANGIHPTDATALGGGGPWITTDPVDDATLGALASAGYRELVVPGDDFTSPPTTGSSVRPFTVNSPHGAGFTAVAADADITGRFGADPGNPVLAASQIVALLAQIYFEYPNYATPRGVVALPPGGWSANPTLVATLLAALASSQIVDPVTVAGLFAAVAPATSCSSGCRLASGAGSSGLPVAAIRTQLTRVYELSTAIVASTPSSRTIPVDLGDTILAGQSDPLQTTQQEAILHNTGLAVDAQRAQLSLAGSDQTVTLGARTGQIPITIDKAPAMDFPVTGSLTLTSDRLLFQNGQSRISLPPCAAGSTTSPPGCVPPLTRATNPIYVPVQARTSGEFKVDITYSSPGGGLVLTNGLVTVRSDAVSLVGVFLSVGAVVVLAGWWIRTSIRRRRKRRADDLAGSA